jgi:hypothetical protein
VPTLTAPQAHDKRYNWAIRWGLVRSASAVWTPEQIRQLAGLGHNGVLSDEGFESKKTELLSKT